MIGLWQSGLAGSFRLTCFRRCLDIVSRTVGILLSWLLLSEVLLDRGCASSRDCSGPSCWAA